MKKLFLTPIVFALVFTFGCQETSITDPPITAPEESQYQNSEFELTKNSINSIKDGRVTLKRILFDPARRSRCKLGGEVKYRIQKIFDDEEQFTSNKRGHIKVWIKMSSLLCELDPTNESPSNIEAESVDLLFLGPTSSVKFLSKTYKVSNRTDIAVFVTYEIGPNYLKVEDIELHSVEIQN